MKRMLMNRKSKLTALALSLSIAFSSSSQSLMASSIEQSSSTNLIRSEILIENDLKTFGTNGIRLVPPNLGLNQAANLNTNNSGQLRWNGNPILNIDGDVITSTAADKLTGQVPGTTIPTEIATATELRAFEDTKADTANAAINLDTLFLSSLTIDTAVPQSTMDIEIGSGTLDPFMVSSTNDADGDVFIVKNDTKVGINTNNPNTTLEVATTQINDGIRVTGPAEALTVEAFRTTFAHLAPNGEPHFVFDARVSDSSSDKLSKFGGNESVGLRYNDADQSLSVISAGGISSNEEIINSPNDLLRLKGDGTASINSAAIPAGAKLAIAGTTIFEAGVNLSGTATLKDIVFNSVVGDLNLGDGVPDNSCTEKGLVRYNHAMCEKQFCNGQRYVRVDGSASVYKNVFVTSQEFTANLGGFAGADQKCQTAADAAGLAGRYIAIISGDPGGASAITTNFNAMSRIPSHTKLKLLNGTIVNSCDLWDGTIDAPINIDENGNVAPDPNDPNDTNRAVWTGTSQYGVSISQFPGGTCNAWQLDTGGGTVFGVGDTLFSNNNWTNGFFNPKQCLINNLARLYCAEV